MKQCYKCKEWKSEDCFSKNMSVKDGLATYCKPCEVIRIKEYKKNNPDKVKAQRERYRIKNKIARKEYRDDNKDIIRDYILRNKYGINTKRYMKQYIFQNGLCAICNQPPDNENYSLCVDHDHKTNKFRGLLCRSCNVGLGFFKDDPKLLSSALKYLENEGFSNKGSEI